jgi:pimeloyl-ACP methyl ester carboxylesterase
MPHTAGRPSLWYERRGSGAPLLLITGFGISGAVFEPVLDRYAERFSCIVFDNRGSGRSQAPLRPTSMPELAADAVGLLDELGIASAHVYGVSMGGMIAQEVALRFPERVRGLVLGCTSPGGPRAVRPTVRELRAVATAAAGAPRSPVDSTLAAVLFSERFRRDEPERAHFLLEHFRRHLPAAQGVAAQLLASVFHDTVSRLDQVQAPTLVLHGERDVMAPLGNARMLAERIPNAELAIVPGAGHAYALERPDVSFNLFASWYARHAPIAPGVARRGLTARVEPVTRALGLPIGAARTGASLLARATPPR